MGFGISRYGTSSYGFGAPTPLPGPTISFVSPSHGFYTYTATPVIIIGSHFILGDTVFTFDGNAATNVVVLSPTVATCDAPANSGTGPVDVVVTTSNGSRTGIGLYTYTNPPAPEILSVTPNSGLSPFGVSVTIRGSWFAPGTQVLFGNVYPSATVVDAGTITTFAPGREDSYVGFVDVTVSNNYGSHTLLNGFEYLAVPAAAVASIDRNEGSIAGGEQITIRGTSIGYGGTTVSIGGIDIDSVLRDSPEQIRVTVPASESGVGPVDVVVTTDYGTVTVPNGFTYRDAPIAMGGGPTESPVEGGVTINLIGGGFVPGTTMSLGGVLCTDIVITDEEHLSCKSPPHAVGTVDIVLSSEWGSNTYPDSFLYVDVPRPTSVSPNNAFAGASQNVTVIGTNFTDDCTVTIGNVSATNVVFVNDTSLTCDIPVSSIPGPGTVDVVVTNSIGTHRLQGGFTYTRRAAPTISSVATANSLPNSGVTSGGTDIVVRGTGFTNSSNVKFGDSDGVDIDVVSSTEIHCTTPAHAEGWTTVHVTTEWGTSESLLFLFVAPPTITGFFPPSGVYTGGVLLTVYGTGFNTSPVDVGLAGLGGLTKVQVLSDTVITGFTPVEGAEGSRQIRVQNNYGTVDSAGYYQEVAPGTPQVFSVTPNVAPKTGGTPLVFEGVNFTEDTDFIFQGGTHPTNIVIESPTRATAISPVIGTVGYTNLFATNLYGTSIVWNGFFFLNTATAAATYGIDAYSIRVMFSDLPVQESALQASNYTVSGGVEVVRVLKETDYTFLVKTTKQVIGTTYTFTSIVESQP